MSRNYPPLGSSTTDNDKFHCDFKPIDVVKLWKEKLFFDITIELDGRQFQAHRFVLYSRSPVFMKMFTTDTEDKHKDHIKFDDNLINFNADSFELLLAYLYTGDVVLTQENVLGVLSVSDYFGIEQLREQTIEFLVKVASEENALVIFKTGFLFTAPKLTFKTYPMIWNSIDKNRDQINELSYDEMVTLLGIDDEDDEYDRDENIVFNVTLQWIRQQNKWNYLEQLLDKIYLDRVDSSHLMETLSDRFIRSHDTYFKQIMKVIRPRVVDDDQPKFKKRKTYNKSDGTFTLEYRDRNSVHTKSSRPVLVRGLPWILEIRQDEENGNKFNMFMKIDTQEMGWTFLTENKATISPCSLDFEIQNRKILKSRRHLFAPVDKLQNIGFFDLSLMKPTDHAKPIKIKVDFSVVITMA